MTNNEKCMVFLLRIFAEIPNSELDIFIADKVVKKDKNKRGVPLTYEGESSVE